MPLTVKTVANAKPKAKLYRLSDGGGMYLEVTPSGSKWWRLKYRYGGKEKRLAIGVFPDVSLKQAREQRDKAREMLRDGIDPSMHKQALKAALAEQSANSFKAVALEWFAKQSIVWSAGHSRTVLQRLEKNAFPWLAQRPIAKIKPSDLLKVLRRIEGRGAHETAHRVQVILSQIFRYAVATDRIESDPSRDLRGALTPVKPQHLAAIVDPKRVGYLLRAIDVYEGSFPVKCALKLSPMWFVRPGELRHARWEDFDLKKREWRFLVSKTKTEHIVPLARQAIEILEELKPLTGKSEWLFPSARSDKRPMSNNAILAALRNMGFSKEEMSGHGFRAMARTLLDEQLGVRIDLIEHQLAHSVRDPLGRAYNRTTHLKERKKMMQKWADFLDGLKKKMNPRKKDG